MDYNANMLLRTLGGLELTSSPFKRPKPLLLLCYLALEGPKERRYLAELFWREATDPMNRLAVTLARLRKGAPGTQKVDDARVWASVNTDAQALLKAVEHGEYEETVALYGGPFLEGVYFEDLGSELEEWLYGTRDFLAAHVKTAQLALAEAEAGEGRFQDAARRAEAAYKVAQTAGLEPVDITRLYTLMLAGGNPRAVTLQEEAEMFGVKLVATPNEARDTLRHAARTTRDIPSNLPGRSSSFVGRDLELAELGNMLANPDARLVTVVGPAGVGKTRLALEAARQQLRLAHFRGGVYFAALDALSNASAIPNKLAEALGLPLQGTSPPDIQIQRHIGANVMLLVLDNYEHLLDGVGVAADLLQACPNLKLLVTSRERLNLQEEWLFTLEGLSFANEQVNLEPLLAYDAISLFTQRAKQAQPAFSLTEANAPGVQAICRLVEGLPLGLELAATWVRVMPCAEIAEEIEKNLDFLTTSTRNLAERHRSLRAAFEHSWRLLEPKEQRALRQLSVFRGGFTRDAAAEVAGASIPVLASLLDKSLLRVSEQGRYGRHPLLYQYTQEKLAEQPVEQAKAEAKHATYFSRLAETLHEDSKGARSKQAYQRLEAELENFRAAVRWAIANKHTVTLDVCGKALGGYFFDRWRGDELVTLWTSALDALDETNPAHRVTRAGLMARLGVEYIELRRLDEAEALAERALTLLRPLQEGREPLGDMFGCYLVLAIVAQQRGQFQQAIAYSQEVKALGLVDFEGRHLNNLGLLETRAGNYAAAKEYLLRALEHNGRENRLREFAKSLDLLGNAYHYASELEEAKRYYQECVTLVREQGPFSASDDEALLHLGFATLESGNPDEAEVCAHELLEKHPQPDNVHTYALELSGMVAMARGEYDQATNHLQQVVRLMLAHFGSLAAAKVDDHWTVLLAFAELRIKQQCYLEVAALLGFVRPQMHEARNRDTSERLLAELRVNFSPQALEQALAEGEEMSLETAVQKCLSSD